MQLVRRLSCTNCTLEKFYQQFQLSIYVVDSLDRERLGKAKEEFQGTCALTGDGLYEGLDWLVTALKELQVSGRHIT
ncbi:hypothetical protein GW17_00032204 [Ensete ventricosum]|uniref:Uncharacterized protein n=1 Tax=Ensete ventricosum TaxID=4639 RepID=A0A427ACD1_ENSVE|nr:hypothetical protein B296_00023715 [Ensete ventricosum]RWW04566.1 hypothetical protein GW17_00032204 [Ensete ventricosum]RZR79625.1 hypothetical protein BHM03_00005404 [Ensete ventricosum]